MFLSRFRSRFVVDVLQNLCFTFVVTWTFIANEVNFFLMVFTCSFFLYFACVVAVVVVIVDENW